MDQTHPATHQGQTKPHGHKKPAASVQRKRPNADDVKIGQRVRARRLQLGMSQEKLGDALGLTFQQVQKYEKGTNRIGGSRMIQIARTLTCPIDFFYGDIDQPTDAPADPVAMLAASDSLTRAMLDRPAVRAMRRRGDEGVTHHRRGVRGAAPMTPTHATNWPVCALLLSACKSASATFDYARKKATEANDPAALIFIDEADAERRFAIERAEREGNHG